ncbi:MAG: hypothetical protein BWY27_00962 [Bacteroidetes bacterium ADurb.Bin234]|nr:MAG: hypothetical protein BWY27_00962 [Bacteroidetes bacterium ADurb.Bin234]
MLNHRYLITILLSLFSFQLNAQTLSDKSFISVLSCGEGNELYSTFGHTAIRVYDSLLQTDIVFNYGTFDFNTPNFYIKFSQGRLPYMLSVTSFENFVAEYRYEGRFVYEQILALSTEEKENLYNLLIENYRPENRYYAYDFFMDNCATRVRDIINKSLIDRTFFIETNSDTNASFRNLIYPYLESMLWWRLGIDIVLGMRCDHHASNTQYMFLPYELMNQLDTITISGKHIIEKKTMILPQTKEPLPKSISPTLLAYILLVIVLFAGFWEYKTKKYFKVIDILLFLVLSLLSLLILYLWFLSNHYTTKFNLNLLWANPMFIYLLLRLQKSNLYIIIFLLSCSGIVLLGFWFLPQAFNPAVFPICLIIVVRMLHLLRIKKQKNFKG